MTQGGSSLFVVCTILAQQLIFFIAGKGTLSAAEPISDERLRMEALHAAFPAFPVALERLRVIDRTWTTQTRVPLVFPDAFAAEKVYIVTGPPQDDRERCAAQDLLSHRDRKAREVRFQVFKWPAGARDDVLMIVQYRFTEASPSDSCPSIAALLHLIRSGDGWEVRERLTLETIRHRQLESVAWLNLTGTGYEELVVESDSGSPTEDRFGSDLHIFNLTLGRFQELLEVPSRSHATATADTWTQTLDVPSTLRSHGGRFCFVKIVYAAGHRWLRTPQVSQACYPARRP